MEKIEYKYFKHSVLNQEQAKKLMKHLIKESLIDPDTNEQDFLYYFSGTGCEPIERLKWQSSVILLAIYIKAIGNREHRPEWKVAENIFEGISASSLSDNYSKPFSKNSSRSFDTFFENKKRVDEVIANL